MSNTLPIFFEQTRITECRYINLDEGGLRFMKKTGIALLALLMCLGGRPPMVLAEEAESVQDDDSSETLQEEIEVIEEAAEEEQAAAAEEDEIVEEEVQEESSEEENLSLSYYEVLPTEHGRVSVSSYTDSRGNWWKIACSPDEGYVVASVSALDDNGHNYIMRQDDENNYYALKGVFVTIEVLFEGNPHPLYVDPDETHNVTFLIDGEPVTEARAGQKVQAVIDLGEHECISSIFIRSRKNIAYNAELIREAFCQQVYQFTMIDDEARLELVFAADGAAYADENGEIHRANGVKRIDSAGAYSVVTLNSGWYIVNGNVTIQNRIEIDGDVNIILPDDKTLTCYDGIHNGKGNSLTIWGQEKGNGFIDSFQPSAYQAGIGGNRKEDGGTFILHSGRVDTDAGEEGAGVGGGQHGDGGIIRIYGGEVYGEGDDADMTDGFFAGGAGIGGGQDRDAGYIEINGGNVRGRGGIGNFDAGAGIGSGSGNDVNGGTIVINGGSVNAVSEQDGAGIGGGTFSGAGNITINGGVVSASGAVGAGIGAGSEGSGGSIHINGGTIDACSSNGAGIGGTKTGDADSIDICGGTITAHSRQKIAIGYVKDRDSIWLAYQMRVEGVELEKRYEALATMKDITIYEAY